MPKDTVHNSRTKRPSNSASVQNAHKKRRANKSAERDDLTTLSSPVSSSRPSETKAETETDMDFLGKFFFERR